MLVYRFYLWLNPSNNRQYFFPSPFCFLPLRVWPFLSQSLINRKVFRLNLALIYLLAGVWMGKYVILNILINFVYLSLVVSPFPKLTSTDCNLFPYFMSPFHSTGVLAIWDCGPSILHFREWFLLKSSVLLEILGFLAFTWKKWPSANWIQYCFWPMEYINTCIVQTVNSARLQNKDKKLLRNLVTAVFYM